MAAVTVLAPNRSNLRVMRKLPGILSLCVALMMVACSTDDRGSDFVDLPQRGWAYGDTLQFTPLAHLDSAAAPVRGRLSVAVQHSNDYEWSNLWLEVTTPVDSLHVYRDTVQLTLADPYGHWTGSGFGSSYQNEVAIPHAVTLDRDSRVSVRHIMRVDTLHQIFRVGISLSKE